MGKSYLRTWGWVVLVMMPLHYCQFSEACSGYFTSTLITDVTMSVQPEDPGYCIKTHIDDSLASASPSARLDKKLSGAKGVFTGFFKWLIPKAFQRERAEACFGDRYGPSTEGDITGSGEDDSWRYCVATTRMVQGIGRSTPPPAPDVDASNDNERCNADDFIFDFDELVDGVLEADREEDALIDVDELLDDLFARDREEYERTHMRVVPFVSPEESIPAAVEAALERDEIMLESLISAMLAADLELSAEASPGFEQQVFDFLTSTWVGVRSLYRHVPSFHAVVQQIEMQAEAWEVHTGWGIISTIMGLIFIVSWLALLAHVYAHDGKIRENKCDIEALKAFNDRREARHAHFRWRLLSLALEARQRAAVAARDAG